jgi:hypothetical protein
MFFFFSNWLCCLLISIAITVALLFIFRVRF